MAISSVALTALHFNWGMPTPMVKLTLNISLAQHATQAHVRPTHATSYPCLSPTCMYQQALTTPYLYPFLIKPVIIYAAGGSLYTEHLYGA